MKVSDQDITSIATFLGMEEEEFIADYTRLRPARDGLALTDQADGSCVFLEGQDCRVQAVKPAQCRGFPNEWNFPGWRAVCKAKPITDSELLLEAQAETS